MDYNVDNNDARVLLERMRSLSNESSFGKNEKHGLLKEMEYSNDSRTLLERVRCANGKGHGMLLEEAGGKKSIAITDDPKFGQNVLSSQIEDFRASVESGAQFGDADEENVADSPLIYMPDEGNLVFSGVIPCLNNLKWQFVLKTSTGSGCFVWADGLIINKDNMQILNKLYGFYLNWREEWNAEAADLDKMVKNMDD